jgi:recombinational DNA repair protein RecT
VESLSRDRTKASEALFAYATAVMNTGERAFQIMTQSEIKQIMDQSVKATGNDTPWKKWPAEQYKKTVVKRFTKLLPKSSQDNRLAYAVQMDNLAEAGKLNVSEQGEIIEGEVLDREQTTRRRIEAATAKRQAMNGNGHTAKAVKPAAPTDDKTSDVADNEQ